MPDEFGFSFPTNRNPARRYCHVCDRWLEGTTAKSRKQHHRDHERESQRQERAKAAKLRRENARRLRQMNRLRKEGKP